MPPDTVTLGGLPAKYHTTVEHDAQVGEEEVTHCAATPTQAHHAHSIPYCLTTLFYQYNQYNTNFR